jgi:hypothetical protein
VTNLSARTTWSCAALVAAVLGFGAPGVVINEIHFNPADKNAHEEFIELANAGAAPVDLSGWLFSTGVKYVFPEGTLIEPGGYLVIAEDPAGFTRRFGSAVQPLGPWEGRLANAGERLVLLDAAGELVDQVDYSVGFPWPTASAKTGRSLELINPALDNDLGGSWRAAGMSVSGPAERVYLIGPGDGAWRYRKGTSNPPADWRAPGFVEDGTWLTGRTVIGYGGGGEATLLADMKGGYSTIYTRHTFTIASAADIPQNLTFGHYIDDGAVVWINGIEVARFYVPAGDLPYNAVATSHNAQWEYVSVANPGALLVAGLNVIAIHAVNAALASADFAFDAQLFVPADGEVGTGRPTPGARNSVYADNAPPQIRQVAPRILQPSESENNYISAKITDPDGVASVTLSYQIVAPGRYIPACFPVPKAQLEIDAARPRPVNPAFEDPANWITVGMNDFGVGGDLVAGDSIYTAMIPRMANRTLVRYRITATDTRGAAVRAPYADDPSLNFAYFVYNGVPDYHAATSINGAPTTYPAAELTSLPVYYLITRNEDFMQAVAPTPDLRLTQGNLSRYVFNWEGTIVYEGVVYDHITYRLRGANGRYQDPPDNPYGCAGKRHWRFRFHRGRYLKARDHWGNRYPEEWESLNVGRMFGNRLDGNWGLPEQVNNIFWNANGVPSPESFSLHFRVIDGESEAPSGATGQYLGDFWGLAWAFENYDGDFLDAHDLPKGNLYKLINDSREALAQRRYHARDAVADGADFYNIENNLRPARPDAWLLAYVDYDKWYRYHALCQALQHYDYWADANKNAAWYFEPVYSAENSYYGRMWTLPFDHDATWGPTWNYGVDRPYDAIFGGGGKPEFQKDYRAHIRHVRDLLWQRDQLEPIIRQTAAFILPLQNPDIDRFRNAPAQACRQYFPAANQRTVEAKANDMLVFAFTGGSWPGGTIGAGGRAAFLDAFADTPDQAYLPAKPSVIYTGPSGYPLDRLTFRASDFADPQGAHTFKAMRWRIAEVSALVNPGSIPLADPRWKEAPLPCELAAVWESPDITTFTPDIGIPPHVLRIGANYRVRVRMQDATNYWSHWSAPVEFFAGAPSAAIPAVAALRVTEIMYNPRATSDFEFIELVNTSGAEIDLAEVRFRAGVKFRFRDSAVKTLGPHETVVIVKNLAAFSRRYATAGMRIAGEYGGSLNGAGERIVLAWGACCDIQDFSYSDQWYPETDGLGYSLNALDTGAPEAQWSTAENWFPSSVIDGTPGAMDAGGDGGFLRPGDVNLDGRLDISDAVGLLRLLFAAAAVEPPCEGAGVAEDGNLALLDFNGDARVDIADAVYLLAYLFQRGPAHRLGAGCARIEGCPRACFSR